MRTQATSDGLNYEKVWAMFQETDKKFQEAAKISKETDKKIRELANLFTSQWGKLIEALVEPACLRLFKERNIEIEQTISNMRARKGGEEMEFDVVLVDSTEMVVVEVKTTFRPEYIADFKEKLNKFKHFFPQYTNYKIYGAVAALKFEGESDKASYRNGLFVLKSSGEGLIKIVNDKKFVPLVF